MKSNIEIEKTVDIKSIYNIAEKAGISRQLLSYLLRSKSLKGAEKIGRALDIEPRDLIK